MTKDPDLKQKAKPSAGYQPACFSEQQEKGADEPCDIITNIVRI